MKTFANMNLLVALAAFSAACVSPDDSELEDVATVEEAEVEAEAETDTPGVPYNHSTYLTPYTSEEYAPIECNAPHVVSNFYCKGSYCDNIRAECQVIWDTVNYQSVHATYGHSYWTDYFSEETYANYRICNPGYVINGISCKGKYCDNVAVKCQQLTNATVGTGCNWGWWFSEEYPSDANIGYSAVTGMQCRGSYCDEKRLLFCPLTVR